MISLRTHKPEVPLHVCHLIFQLEVVCMVKKFMVEKSGVEKFMLEKSGVERSGVEAWG